MGPAEQPRIADTVTTWESHCSGYVWYLLPADDQLVWADFEQPFLSCCPICPVHVVKQPHPAQTLGWLQSPHIWSGSAFWVPGLMCGFLLKDRAGKVRNDDDDDHYCPTEVNTPYSYQYQCHARTCISVKCPNIHAGVTPPPWAKWCTHEAHAYTIQGRSDK